MAASQEVKDYFKQFQMTEEEKIEHQKLIDAGIIGVIEDHFFSEDYARDEVKRIADWEKSVEEHGGDRNWAVKEYAKKKGWI